VFGITGPDVGQLTQRLSIAFQWTTVLSQTAAWYKYAKSQYLMGWKDALLLVDTLKAPFDLASTANPALLKPVTRASRGCSGRSPSSRSAGLPPVRRTRRRRRRRRWRTPWLRRCTRRHRRRRWLEESYLGRDGAETRTSVAIRSARYVASRPTPDKRPEPHVYCQGSPRKKSPGAEVTPRS